MLNGNARNGVKLTTRGQYALMAMTELADGKNGSPLALSEIAERTNISLSYLEQLVAALRRHELVKSYRGPGGGYILAKSSDDIMVADILIAAEDSLPAKKSKANGNCNGTEHHLAHDLWSHISELLHATLNKISLQDVMAKRLRSHPVSSKLFEMLL